MIPVPAALESHLQGEVTTHCFAWIIRRQDGLVQGFTDHDRTLSINGVACEPQTGMNSSEASTTLGLSIAGGEVEGALSSAKISDADIENGRYDGAAIEVYLVNWSAPDQFMLLRRWTAAKISRSGTSFVMELKGVAALFDAVRGRRIMRLCDASLGDGRCGVNLDDPLYFAGGVVVTAGSTELTATELTAFASGWFANGYLTWTSGSNVGAKIRVLDHSGTTLRLSEPPVSPIAAGDNFRVVAGCDKSFATCKAKFANGVNFRGFPHLPGNDAAYTYVSGDQEYDGSALVQ
ncbi:DUF2163 domain-containing protein [Brucella haematophila]|uniref:DUF2163 domain-containing protein n=1 Tax=Brucella haematophila TaxID=419474 RepID=UPI00110EF6E2|nr:DUF2163 domain-containing protein [Brucella haematophila]TMV01515.1 DUF2163 domain-containing protein [Brucella haematophila]